MSEDTRVGMPAPGWLYDAETGQTRWWNGVRWTDHAKPLDPVVRTGAEYRPAAAAAHTSAAAANAKNPPARAALVLVVISVLGVAGLVWLGSGLNPATGTLLAYAQLGLLATALVLSVIGLVIAIRRPTRKSEAIIGLVLSTLILGFLAFRIATAPGAVDAAALEGEIAEWAVGQTGEVSHVTCPDSPPQAAGAVFTCTVIGATGTEWEVAVTVHADSVTWEQAP